MTPAGLRSMSARLALPTTQREARLRALRDALSIVGIGVVVFLFSRGGYGVDFGAYWSVNPDHPYNATSWGLAFRYTPPIIPLAAPWRLLEWPQAYYAWLVLQGAVLIWLCRSWTLAALAFVPISSELYHGNIHLLIAAALVIGLRYPSAWAFMLLTKVTPGIALIWSLVRREWWSLLVALGTTALIAGVSFVLAPGLWTDWIRQDLSLPAAPIPNEIRIPLLIRLPIGITLAAVAARTGRRWLLAPAVTMALPLLWFHGLAVLAALPRLIEADRGSPLPPGSGTASRWDLFALLRPRTARIP